MSKGFVVAEQGHVVQMMIPVDVTAAATSDVINMENWAHASIIVSGGAGSSSTITVSDANAFTSSGATMVFRYQQEQTAAGDTMEAALAWATTAGVGIGTATGVLFVIEIDADELRDGYPMLMINATDPGAGKVISAVAILSGGRYQKDITATVIA